MANGARLRRRERRKAKKQGYKALGKQAGKALTAGTGLAQDTLSAGMGLGQQILPEVFEGGSGLDRIDFGGVDFNNINQFLDPSVQEAQALQGDLTGQYDKLLGLAEGRLGGLDSAENMALKESLFRDIDRQKAGAMRDVARQSGLGAGAAFGQRQALGRDYADNALRANRDLTLANVDIKRQALQDYANAQNARTGALGSAQDRLSALRGLQATAQQATDQFNTQGNFLANQFNAGQQGKELAAKVGAISSGTGLVGDQTDQLKAEKAKNDLMQFLAQQDQNLFSQAQALFG